MFLQGGWIDFDLTFPSVVRWSYLKGVILIWIFSPASR